MSESKGLYLLMAAGFSKRFGSSKLLHRVHDGQTIVASSIARLRESGCDFTVVIRHDDQRLIDHVQALSARTMTVQNADQGLSSVIAECVSQMSKDEWEWLGVCLADMPYISASTFLTLSQQASAEYIVRPQYQGKPGHPVLFGKMFFSSLMSIDGDEGAKSIILRHGDALKSIAIDDPMIAYDIDVPGDII